MLTYDQKIDRTKTRNKCHYRAIWKRTRLYFPSIFGHIIYSNSFAANMTVMKKVKYLSTTQLQVCFNPIKTRAYSHSSQPLVMWRSWWWARSWHWSEGGANKDILCKISLQNMYVSLVFVKLLSLDRNNAKSFL